MSLLRVKNTSVSIWMSCRECENTLMLIWSFIMPAVLAALTASSLSKRLFTPKSTYLAIMKAKEVLMSERELEKERSGKFTQYMMNVLLRVQNLVDLEHLILADIRNMLVLMGIKKRPERELAGYVVNALIGSLPVLIVPLLTNYYGYLSLYPLAVVFLIYRQNLVLRKQYKKWQTEITKDLPELIDKLRISFAGGRDYISAFKRAGENSGLRMGAMIDKLINDLQCMRPAQALDLFAGAFKMPVVTKFTSAVKIAVEYGYEPAENYFRIIENDITEVRRVAVEELTKSKPEKVYQLYLVLFFLAAGSLLVKGWEIFSRVNQIM